MLLKFNKFIKEAKFGNLYGFGCVMIYPLINSWNGITSIINKNDVYEPTANFGIEDKPHITLLYGLHNNVTEDDVFEILKDYTDIDIEISINGIDIFENDKFDVVKLNINCPILFEINERLKELPHTSDYPDYSPHMTISFVNKGSADKYKNADFKLNIESDKFVYTKSTGEEYEWILA